MTRFAGLAPFSSKPPKLVAPEVEWNIRLDVRNVRNDIDANTERAEAVISILRNRIGNVQFRRLACPDGPDFLWAGTRSDVEDLDDLAYTVSEIAQQECIAVYLRGINEGKLVGPQARNWPEFNLNAFRSFQLEE